MENFCYRRRVAFSDTDAMGVTHHANYLRFCEEARVAWMRENGLSHTHFPQCDRILAVLNYRVWHMKTSTFDDEILVYLQVRHQGVRILFQYAMFKIEQGEEVRIAEGETLHISVDKNLKPARPVEGLMAQLEKEKWTETWLSNS